MSRFSGGPSSTQPGLALAVDAKPTDPARCKAWRIPYGWLLILGEKRELGSAKHYRDLDPELTVDGARRVLHEELAANDRLAWGILRCKDFDPYVDRWFGRRQRPERDHDLVPERVRLDAELEDE